MISFVLRRLLASIPTLIGISLVTFFLLSLATEDPSNGANPTAADSSLGRTRLLGLHLPLFVNFSVEDARTLAELEVARLKDERTAPNAIRTIAAAGGAWLPHILPLLPKASKEDQAKLLEALSGIAEKINLYPALSAAKDPFAFWQAYWETYRSDFQPIRAARLVRRVVKREDRLAAEELVLLNTFCLPQLMSALSEDLPLDAHERVLGLVERITGQYDPLPPNATVAQKEAVLKRWSEWWGYRRDRYTVLDSYERLTGTITETRYFQWIRRMASLDFGFSIRDGRPIVTKLQERMPITLMLSFLSLLVAYGVAIPIGILSAIKRRGWFDQSATAMLFLIYSFPTFWMAVLLLNYFAGSRTDAILPFHGMVSWGSENWPIGARIADFAKHLVLPVFCLSLVPMAMLARYQRLGMLQTIHRDFMRTARAKGLSPTGALLRHGLRNGVIPIVTILGAEIPYLVSGSVVVERIFGIPGMGYETFEAIRANDQPWLMAVITATALLTLLGVILADVIYALVDPRIIPGSKSRSDT